MVFTLTAYLTGSEDWLFVAWRRSTYYQTSAPGERDGFKTYTYVYEIPLDGEETDKLSDEFRAVFARKDNSSIAVNAYTGSALQALTAVNLSRNNLYIGNATLESYGGITAEVIGFGAVYGQYRGRSQDRAGFRNRFAVRNSLRKPLRELIHDRVVGVQFGYGLGKPYGV